MSNDRPWYREPETFIALAALVVSLSAVVVGIYEASLQRTHDRAEVWPHLELETFITPQGASLFLENTGIGPAVVESVVVTVDGHPRRDWPDAIGTLMGRPPGSFNYETVVGHAVRPGERLTLAALDKSALPPSFWPWIARLGITVCYRSVFNDRSLLTEPRMGNGNAWADVRACTAQRAGTSF